MIHAIHRAGPYSNLLQHCTRCGAVLTDYRNCMWPDDQPPPAGWQEGANVWMSGRSGAVVDDPPNCLPTGAN